VVVAHVEKVALAKEDKTILIIFNSISDVTA
jgi:hypothetical protein